MGRVINLIPNETKTCNTFSIGWTNTESFTNNKHVSSSDEKEAKGWNHRAKKTLLEKKIADITKAYWAKLLKWWFFEVECLEFMELGSEIGKVKKPAKNWWDPKGICYTIADGHRRFISCDSSYVKSLSLKHMVLSSSNRVNPFCGLPIMKSSDDSIREKDLKAWVINSEKCVVLADVIWVFFIFILILLDILIFMTRVSLGCWSGQSLGSIGDYICHRWDGIRGRYHPRPKSKPNQHPEGSPGQPCHSRPGQQSLGVLWMQLG